MITLDQGGAAREWCEIFAPPPHAREMVEHFSIVRPPEVARASELVGAEATDPGWRIVPDMSPHLMVHFYDDRVHAFLIGARSAFLDRPMDARLFSVSARFQPGSLPLLTGFPSRDFTDRGVPLDAVWGVRGRVLNNRLEDLPRTAHAAPSEALEVISDFVSRDMESKPRADWRARWLRTAARDQSGAVRIGKLARTMGLGVRTLRQVANDWFGLSPKRFARIHRLFAGVILWLLELGRHGIGFDSSTFIRL